MSPQLVELIPFIVLIIVFVFLIPALLRWLWNITMTHVFVLRKITYWESFRLLIISFVLIGVWGFIQ